MKMKIDQAIRIYADFLNMSWISIAKLIDTKNNKAGEISIYDWLQANWEILVERKVLNMDEHLEIYDEGADYNGESSRITDLQALPTHKIIVRIKNGSHVFDFLNDENVVLDNVTFDKLVGFKEGFYVMEPEFKYILLTDNNGLERVIALDDIEFGLEEL